MNPVKPGGGEILETICVDVIAGTLSILKLMSFLMSLQGVDTSSTVTFKLVFTGPELLVEDIESLDTLVLVVLPEEIHCRA
jgi:hypothetical protein